jgi:hypothetical protein
MVCLDSRWDFSSLNTFSCRRYSSDILFSTDDCGIFAWNVTHLIKYLVCGLVRGIFFVHDVNIAFCAFKAYKTIGSWVWSIHPLF